VNGQSRGDANLAEMAYGPFRCLRPLSEIRELGPESDRYSNNRLIT
jgi:hypothetical protein